MSQFTKNIATAKPSQGKDWGKEGTYWVLIQDGKLDTHSQTHVEQLVFRGVVIRVLDSGPTGDARFKPDNGDNAAPHKVNDPMTFYFSPAQTGAEARAKRFFLVAANLDESKLPSSAMPIPPYSPLQVPPETTVDRTTGVPVPPGTPNSVVSMHPIECMIMQSTNPAINILSGIVVEYRGRGTKTAGRGAGGTKKNIIAVDPIRRVWAREVKELIEKGLMEEAKPTLLRDGLLDRMLARDVQ